MSDFPKPKPLGRLGRLLFTCLPFLPLFLGRLGRLGRLFLTLTQTRACVTRGSGKTPS